MKDYENKQKIKENEKEKIKLNANIKSFEASQE